MLSVKCIAKYYLRLIISNFWLLWLGEMWRESQEKHNDDDDDDDSSDIKEDSKHF